METTSVSKKKKLHFYSVKSKLATLMPDAESRRTISEVVIKCHESFKRGLFFLKLFCLELESRAIPIPPPDHSLMIACLNQVCERSKQGKQCKSTEAVQLMTQHCTDLYTGVYPDQVDMKGLSMCNRVVADQMLTTVLTDVCTRFRSRCVKLCTTLGAKNKREASKLVDSAFFQRWEDVPNPYQPALKRVLPENPLKSTFYDLKASPSRYLEATLKLCRELGTEDCKFSFCPTRSTCIPCNVKLDTECMSQIFLKYKTCLTEKKKFGKEDRNGYNDWVWNQFLATVDTSTNALPLKRKADCKLKRFRFHHEMTTDGVSASLLYSREIHCSSATTTSKMKTSDNEDSQNLLGTQVGVDPGKNNLVTMTDSRGNTLKYTCRQRHFEGKLKRYQLVLNAEKAKEGSIQEAELLLSEHSRKTNDASDFVDYLTAKKLHDEKTSAFYRQEKWRGWKFRLHCSRNRSQDLFLNRVEKTYGKDCTLHYGDWSRSDQMKWCPPTLGVGMKKLCQKRFKVKEVDEYRTSKICNMCLGELKGYKKRDGKLSRARLCCWNCAGRQKDRSKLFLNRDVNAAANILLVGTSPSRPSIFSRSHKRRSSPELKEEESKKIKLSVDAERSLSDPLD